MELKNEFETLLKWGLLNDDNKRHVIQMAAYLINSLQSTEKKELSRDELNQIIGGARYAITQAKIF